MFSDKFICATREYTTFLNHIPAPLIRKAFVVEEGFKKASITICGLGFYELYINGENITKGHLAPYISNPDDILYYDEYDLTSYLKNGKNVIGIILGNGMLDCPGGTVWDFHKAKYLSSPKVALSLCIKYKNTKTVINADESFKVKPSAILFNDLRCGEIYDARKETPNWNQIDFDDSNWDNAIIAEAPRGEQRICIAEPIVVKRELKPISIKKSQISHKPVSRKVLPSMPIGKRDEGYLYDFGINTAGNVRLKINGQRGQKVIMQFGELLAKDGGLDLRGMSFQPHELNHRNTYILSGEGDEIYIPHFTYHGFRYCLVMGITENQATEDLLTYEVMSSDIKINGGFECSNEIINKLQAATVNSDLSNFYYFPMDCPHREKNGWTADAALSAEQMLFNLTPEKSYKEWLNNIRKAQNGDGALPGIVPTAGWGFDWGNGPSWDRVLIDLPYFTWLYRNDTEIIKDNAHSIVTYFDYISNRRDENGLLHIGLGDWARVGKNPPNSPLSVTDTLVTMESCRRASKMFKAIGYNIQARFIDDLYTELKASARKHLLEEDGITVLGRCQTSQALGINYGLFEESEKGKAFEVLLQIIAENDNKMDCGCVGARELFHVLSNFGYTQLAYEMIVGPEYPSYGHWIVYENATSLFEEFLTPKFFPTSKNHHFFGDISSWFFKHLTGVKVNPYERDCNEVLISPDFISSLSYASGFINLNCGKLEVNWKKKNNIITLSVKSPKKCNGAIKLPCGFVFEDGQTEKSIQNGKNKYSVYANNQ